MIKVLLVYPMELPWYDHYHRELLSEDSIRYCVTGTKQVIQHAIGMEKKEAKNNFRLNSHLFLKIFGGFSGLDRIINDISPNIIISKELNSATTYKISKLSGNFKHIVISDETVPPEKSLYGKFPITRFYFEYSCSRVNYIIFHSVRSKEALLPYCKSIKKSSVIYPTAPVTSDTNAHFDTISDRKFVFLFIGNMLSNKGVTTLIKSVSLLSTLTDKKFLLRMAGKGPLSEFVRISARNNEHLEFLGYVNEAQKENLLKSSDVFVYPSEDIELLGLKRWEEQSPASVMEAMAHGLPVIGSNSGSLPEIIRDPRVIVEQKNFKDLAVKMKMLIERAEYRRELGESNINWSRNNLRGKGESSKVNDFVKEVWDKK